MKSIAVIPARGGSKRIPGKNIKLLNGRPVITYAISLALESNLFDSVLVSTDDDEIREIAQRWGAEVQGLRPKKLSDDFATTVDVIAHELEVFSNRKAVDVVTCIYPVTPLLNKFHLEAGIRLLMETQSAYIISALELPSPKERTFRLSDSQNLELDFDFSPSSRTQDFRPSFYDAGQFYMGFSDSWSQRKPLLHTNVSALVLHPWEAIDVNTEQDWAVMEKLHRIQFLTE